MGQRGPKKTPAAEKKRRGTYRADRDAEPEFLPTWPACPPEYDGIVRAEWERLAPLLTARGMLTEADWLAWRLGMDAYQTYLEASRDVAETGMITLTEKNYPVQNPAVTIAGKAWAATMRFCREFGLTPSARSGLRIAGEGDPAETDPLSQLLSGRAQRGETPDAGG